MPTSTETVELSIVMPCLNEAETLAVCIDKAQGYLERSGVVGEVVIADNGITDGSQEIARAQAPASSTCRPRATAARSWAASRPPAASTSSWATPTTATTSPSSSRSSSGCARATSS